MRKEEAGKYVGKGMEVLEGRGKGQAAGCAVSDAQGGSTVSHAALH